MYCVASDYSLIFTGGNQSLSFRMQKYARKNGANKVSKKKTLFTSFLYGKGTISARIRLHVTNPKL